MTEKEESWFKNSHQVDYKQSTFFVVARNTTPYIEVLATRLYERSKRDLGAIFHIITMHTYISGFLNLF